MNGDLMVEFDASDLLDAHRRTGAAVTVATRTYQHEVPFGVVESTDGRVTGVSEKPTLSFDINAAVYAVEPRALAWLPGRAGQHDAGPRRDVPRARRGR